MNCAKILILEDHPLTLQIIHLTLQRLGYQNISTAGSGEEAFQQLKLKGDFDVLICDIQMASIDGLTFLQQASEFGKINALILCSEIDQNIRIAIKQLARKTGYQVLGELSKPISRKQLNSLLSIYQPDPQPITEIIINENPCITDIQRGLTDEEFTPYFRPIININTNEVIRLEILARWKHYKHGLLKPQHFLEITKHFGLSNEITTTITQQALRFLKGHNLTTKLPVSIKLDTTQLASPNTINTISQILEKEQLPTSKLTIEIAEADLVNAPTDSIESLVRLRLLGCGISIDNFGAGFSSLQRVCEMPCTELKLDASFTRSITYNARYLVVINSILRLTQSLELGVIAKSVETYEQLLYLRDIDCPNAQGNLFSKPMGKNELIPWLTNRNKKL